MSKNSLINFEKYNFGDQGYGFHDWGFLSLMSLSRKLKIKISLESVLKKIRITEFLEVCKVIFDRNIPIRAGPKENF